MQESVIEYFNTYFGGELNESITHEDLIEAALDLIELRNEVLEVLKEADVGRASRAFGARQRLHKAIKDPVTRKSLEHTKEGKRLVKRHEKSSEEQVASWKDFKPEKPKEEPKKSTFMKLDVGQYNKPPKSPPSLRYQRTKQLTKKAVESGPQKGQTPDEHLRSAEANYIKGHDDMSQRIERIKARGAKRGETLKSIGINSSYDPRLKENDEKNKILKFRKNDNDEGPHELGLKNVIRDTQVSADKNRAEVEKENQLAALLKVDTTKSPSQARKEIRKLAKETEQSRASQGKHRARGAEGRRKREAKGQGSLF
jgi:hypothetical protein